MEYTRENPYYARLHQRYLINKKGSTKKTYHISLKIDPKELEYKPGDSIGIIPLNEDNLIKQTLDALNIATNSEKDINRLHKVNICTSTKKLLELILRNTKNKQHQKEINTLLSDKELLKKYLNSHHVWEILAKYPSDISIDDVCSTLRPMLPRFYSIASSDKAIKDEIHLLVAENTYQIRGQTFHGIGSNYLCNLTNINDKIAIYVQKTLHFKLPEHIETPIIMIGPGTGIAPFKAFLQERTAENIPSKNWLFFGERNRDHDYYYQEYLEKLHSDNRLDLDLAFSRDQEEKVYVQDLIRERGAKFFDWVQNDAIIYICGDAKQMAKSVESAILEVFQHHGKMTEEESKNLLKELRRNKRYLSDVY